MQSYGPAMVSVSTEGATFFLLFPDTYSLLLSISVSWGQGPLCQFGGPQPPASQFLVPSLQCTSFSTGSVRSFELLFIREIGSHKAMS